MINFLYKVLLTFNATAWIIVVFFIKEDGGCSLINKASNFIKSMVYFKDTDIYIPLWIPNIFFLAIPILTSYLSLSIASRLSLDTLNNCGDIEKSTNSFLPTYLGYFFIGR